MWLTSADWMGRNMFRRIEVAFPVRDPELRRRVLDEGLREYLADTRDAWSLRSDGKWIRIAPRGARRRARRSTTLLARMREPDEAD